MSETDLKSSVAPTSFTPPGLAPGGSNGREVSRDLSIRELSLRVVERRWLLLAIAAATFGGVAAWTFLATPRYRSEARLRIETQAPASPLASALSDQASNLTGGSLLGFARDELETEIGVLRSDRIADAMIDTLALGVRVTSPEASRARILTARTTDPGLDADGTLALTREANGRYRIERQKLDDVGHLPATLDPGVPLRVGGLTFTLSPDLRRGGPETIKIRILPRYEVHKLLERRLTIGRQEGGSRLVEITYDDPDRALASQVVGRVVDEYVTYSNRTLRGDDTTAVIRLRSQVDSTSRKLGEAESALRAFEERAKLIAPEEQASAQIKRLSAISTHVDAISVERNALSRMLQVIEQRSRGGTDAAAYRQLATFPTLITNRAIQDLLQSLVDLENKRSELGMRRTAANDDYRQLSDRITQIERQLYQVGPQYLESLDQQLATTVNAVTALTDSLNAMPAAAMQYGRLVRDRTVLESIYLALQKQLKTAELKDVLRQERVRVVDAPRAANPDDPVFPKKAVMLVLGAVLGVALALTVALAMELWRPPTA
jgi:tyrosine-protein kinase Etk/Wzc